MSITWWLHPGLHETARMQPLYHQCAGRQVSDEPKRPAWPGQPAETTSAHGQPSPARVLSRPARQPRTS
jgi:hypothetical protein